MKKNLLCLILALLFSFCTLTSCSNEASDPDAPSGMKSASGNAVDYKLYVPDTWTVDISTGIATAYVSDTDKTNVSAAAYSLKDKNMLVEDYWQQWAQAFKETYSVFEYLQDPEDMLLDKVVARKYCYTAKITGVDYKFIQVICIRNSYVYVITYTAMGDAYESHKADLQKIADNFRFI